MFLTSVTAIILIRDLYFYPGKIDNSIDNIINIIRVRNYCKF